MFAALRLYVAETSGPKPLTLPINCCNVVFKSRAHQPRRSRLPSRLSVSKKPAKIKRLRLTWRFRIASTRTMVGSPASALAALAGPSRAEIVATRKAKVNSAIDNVSEQYPAPYRQAILSAAKAQLDPRFILALTNRRASSNHWQNHRRRAGLLQLTMDAAQKYGPGRGMELAA